MRSITRMLPIASSGGTGAGRPSRTARANASASAVYGSRGRNLEDVMPGATGGSPPAARTSRVGRSGGMLNGISTSRRPVGTEQVDPLVGFDLRGTDERRLSAVEVEIAEVSASVPNAGSRRTTAVTALGSPPKNHRATLIG